MIRLRMNKFGISALAVFLTGLIAPGLAQADTIDAVLRDEMPRVVAYLKEHGHKSVGVLKFAVSKGGRTEAHPSGTLGDKMAARLEHGLILLADPASPVEILHDSGRVAAAQGRGLTPRNAEGRRELFEHSYPVAWGTQKKKPDAFLTGEVVVEKDMRSLSIAVQAIAARKPEAVAEVLRIKKVLTDRDVLASLGQGFAIPRRLGHRTARDLDEVAADDAAKRDDTGVDPLRDADAPVKLEITYDDSPVTLQDDPGSPGEVTVRRNKAADPKEGQKVKFAITNTGSDTVGVVLAVNGKSTLFMEDLTAKAPGECTKWILGPGETYKIDGFYMTEDGKDVRGFKVLSDDDSAKSDLAPDQRGIFALYAFRQVATPDSTVLNISSEGGGLARSPAHQAGPRTLPELQAALRVANHTHASGARLLADRVEHRPGKVRAARQHGGRGLVVEDTQSTAGSGLNRVDKPFDPQPTFSLSIRYYDGAKTPENGDKTPNK